MNSVKIEKNAILALKRIIGLHEKMDELLKEADKEPSWDGTVYLYSCKELKVENILYTIPVQVKGKNNIKLLNRDRITYPVEYKNLRNYFKGGGVCYFVIAISDNGEKTTIFYNALTPIKLQSLLKGTEKKKPNQTKSIPLSRLKNSDKNELFKILLQFGHDSREQGAGELIRKSISMEDIEKIDSIRATTFVTDNKEAIIKMESGEACCYGHLADADIWLPFAYDTQTQVKFYPYVKRNEPFAIDGISYYEGFEIYGKSDKVTSIKLSENLMIDIENSKFIFDALTELGQVIKDIQFLEAVQQGKTLYIGKQKFLDYGGAKFENGFLKMMNNYKQLQLAVSKFGINLNKRLGDFTDKDCKAVDELLKIYQGKIRPKKEMAWHLWWWQDKVVPFFMAFDSNGELWVENGTCPHYFKISVGGPEERYVVPSFAMFKRDVWESLYDVDENILLDE